MKKIVRLTESDLVRIVKRVIKENHRTKLLNEMTSPFGVFHEKMDDLGYVVVTADKSNKILPTDKSGGGDTYYIYVAPKEFGGPRHFGPQAGGLGPRIESKNWKSSTFDVFEKVGFETFSNPNNPLWKKVTSKSLIDSLNSEASSGVNLSVYDKMSYVPSIQNIVDAILGSSGFLNDSEAEAEAAFMGIDSKETYNKVRAKLGKDPYKHVKSFMDTSKVYHKKSIDSSMKRLGLLR
jgi:hypothetical protein